MIPHLIAKMAFKKETSQKVVFEETADSPAGSLLGTLYVHKHAVANMLGGAGDITLLAVAGDKVAEVEKLLETLS